MAKGINRLLQGLALRQQQADLAVAAEVASGGEHQVAQAAQAHEGFGARTQRQAQAGHLGQAPGDQRSTGIEPKLQPVTQAGGNGQHVLDRTAHLDTDHVVAGIDPQGRAMEGRHQGIAHRCVGAGRHQSGRLAPGDLLREAGAAEHPGAQAGGHIGTDFMPHHTIRLRLGCLKTLTQPGHRGRAGAQRVQHGTQARHGGGNDD